MTGTALEAVPRSLAWALPWGLFALVLAASAWLAWRARRAELRRRESELRILDLTEQSRATEALLAHRALHDPLTDLANRPLFLDRVRHALERACRPGNTTAVLLLGLDRFRNVNDRLGHAAGDRLLAEVGHRLRRTLRAEDTVARVSGDEFAVLVERLGDPRDARKAAERALSSFEAPFDAPDHEADPRRAPVHLAASLGLAVATPGAAIRAEDLVRDAGIALRRAKRHGGGRIHRFRRLRALGVRVALDDFATGYSSLGTVKTVAVDSLKIDRSFVAGLGSERADTALVTALVRLGRDLGLSVTAEGVETDGQLQALLELGCQRAQGHLFAPALPADAVASFLRGAGPSTAWASAAALA